MELSSLIVLLAACAFKTWASKAYDKHLKPKLFPWEEKYFVARAKREATLILTIPVILYFVKTVADRFFGGPPSYWSGGIVFIVHAFYYDSLANPREDERSLIIRVRIVRQVLIASKLIWFVTFYMTLYGTVGYIAPYNSFSVNDVSFHYTSATMSPTTGLLQEQRYLSYRMCLREGISKGFLCTLFQNFPVPVVMSGLFYVAHLTYIVNFFISCDLGSFWWREMRNMSREDDGDEEVTHFLARKNVSEEEDERKNRVLWWMSRIMRRAKENDIMMMMGAGERRSAGGGAAVVVQ